MPGSTTSSRDRLGVRDYVVRIYRWGHGHPRGLVGVVEEVGVPGRRAFLTLDELWAILAPGRRGKRDRSRRRGGPAPPHPVGPAGARRGP